MGRQLSQRERDVLVAMIQHADDPFLPVTAQQRRSWLAQADGVRAGFTCECGDCPSIDLEGPAPAPKVDGSNTLWAAVEGALLMLFVEGSRLSYLELAPTEDDCFAEFPSVSDIDFSAQFSAE